MNLTTDKKLRKEQPMARGALDYFKNAIADVARVSYIGNKQHNGDAPMHWAREKSTDHADCIVRHLADRGTLDDDGLRHSAKAAWRALALLQLEIEEDAEVDASSDYVAPGASCAIKGETMGQDHDAGKTEKRAGPAHEAPGTIGFEETEAANLATGRDNPYFDVGNRRADGDRMFSIHCPARVAAQIIMGTMYVAETGNDYMTNDLPYCYIAGPMRGIDKFNFPAFDQARNHLLNEGWNVISPADIDRHADTNENTPPDQVQSQATYCYRDFFAIFSLRPERGDAIAMLPGWEKSTGAVGEFFLARWLGLRIIDADTGRNLSAFHQVNLRKGIHKTLCEQFTSVV